MIDDQKKLRMANLNTTTWRELSLVAPPNRHDDAYDGERERAIERDKKNMINNEGYINRERERETK